MKGYWLAVPAGMGIVLALMAQIDRSQPDETQIGASNVAGLTTKWIFHTGGDVSATPSVIGDTVYFPDWGGNLFAVQKTTGVGLGAPDLGL